MAAILGGSLVFAAFVIAGMWATIRVQREQIAARDERIATLIDAVPPRAVQFIVERVGESTLDEWNDGRLTDPDVAQINLAEMGNDRPTLTPT